MKNALNTLRDRFGKDGLAGILLEVAAVMLLVAAFIVPPRGVIDPSVLAGVGELFAFRALVLIGRALDNGKDAKVTHGNTTIQLGDGDGKGDE